MGGTIGSEIGLLERRWGFEMHSVSFLSPAVCDENVRVDGLLLVLLGGLILWAKDSGRGRSG